MKRCLFIGWIFIIIFTFSACFSQDDENPECLHNYTEWETLSEPTCKDIGVAQHSCKKCFAQEYKYLSPLATHTYTDEKDDVCDVCGFQRPLPCAHEQLITIEGENAGCTYDGYTELRFCYFCNEIIQEREIINALGHAESDWITEIEATHGIGGFMYKECTRCKIVLSQEYTAPIKLSELDYVLDRRNKTCSITGLGSYAGENLIIPEKIGDYTVTNILDNAFSGQKTLKTVKLPDTILYIGKNAFYGCSELTEINIPSLTSHVGADCFKETSNLSTIYYNSSQKFLNIDLTEEHIRTIVFGGDMIPNDILHSCPSAKEIILLEGVKHIGSNAFAYCRWLTDIKIPSTLTHIGSYAFEGCHNLKSVYIKDLTAWCNITLSQTYFSHHTTSPMGFADELYLNGELVTNVVIPDSVTSLPPYCFNSEFIESVEFNDELSSIGEAAFRYCSKLKELRIPPSVKNIGSYAFANCTGLEKVVISDVKAWCEISFDGIFANPIYITESFYINDSLVTELTVPSDVTEINDYAFYGANNLQSLYFSNGITSIGDHAFAHCKNLNAISLPESLKSIGNYAFYICSNIADLKLGQNVDYIGDNAFYDCDSLKNIYFSGSESDWNSIIIGKGNTDITAETTIHYNHQNNGL